MKAGFPIQENWVLSSAYGQEKVILNELAAAIGKIGQTDPLSERLDDMMTAVTEACLNAFEHGNRLNEQLPVLVQMILDETGCLFRISDEGTGFQAPERMENKEGALRGWGLLFIDQLADRWTCGRSGGKFYVEMEFKR